MRQTTIEEREIIIKNYKDKKSIREISEIVGKKKSTVHNIIKRYKERGNVRDKKRNLTNRAKINDRSCRFILRLTKQNPKLSAVDLKKQLKEEKNVEVCAETIRRLLKKNKFYARVPRRKPLISKKNQKARLEFAKKFQYENVDFWSKVLFTDETKINIFGSDGKRFVWRMPGKELEDKNIKKTVKYGGGSIMIWGCMSGAGVGKVHVIDGILDGKGYIDILKQNVLSSAEKLGIRENFVFYQDNDPKHTSWNARNWLLYNCPKVLATPAQSPDMNPIEHLWGELKKRLATRCLSSKSDLKQAVLEEWVKIEPSYYQKLIESMPRRLQEVIKYKGKSTKY